MYVWRDPYVCVPWLIRMCAVDRLGMAGACLYILKYYLYISIHIYIHQYSGICTYICYQYSCRCMWRNSVLCVTWLIHMCAVTQCGWHMWHVLHVWHVWHVFHVWHVWRNSFLCVTWLIHICAVTQRGMAASEGTCMHVSEGTCMHVCSMTPSYVRHDSYIGLPWHNQGWQWVRADVYIRVT